MHGWWEGVAGQEHPDVDQNIQIDVCKIHLKRKNLCVCVDLVFCLDDFDEPRYKIHFQSVNDTCDIQNGYDHWVKKEKKNEEEKTIAKKIYSMLYTLLKIGSCALLLYVFALFIIFNAYDCMRSIWWMDCAHVYRTPLK